MVHKLLIEFLDEYENLDMDKEEAEKVWNFAIDQAVKIANNPPCSYSSVLQSKGGNHASVCIANAIKKLKDKS